MNGEMTGKYPATSMGVIESPPAFGVSHTATRRPPLVRFCRQDWGRDVRFSAISPNRGPSAYGPARAISSPSPYRRNGAVLATLGATNGMASVADFPSFWVADFRSF